MITQLPAHEDVKPGLKALSEHGFHLVSLTNSSTAGVAAQFNYAGLTNLFVKRFSVEDVEAFKPHPKPYLMVLKELDIQPQEALMVAAHAWDLAGAKAVGLQTAFIRRPGTTLYPNATKPDYIVNHLHELVDQLTSK
ncbi:HAD-IA family hydrolase [Exilibacterium tricleocarpae]|uniref:HAD-IA family hydrolase n=1 Tax=Exilibacterium tricleocarpae TaxID=2591008 RepID=A0A545ST22_9GAMM|nr:HAD-IA family hydrolase [Exilibacterium tricleocarpae]TQV68112.1 HAD-IA family hydrolase [Exilibacterium tricleocarpae]